MVATVAIPEDVQTPPNWLCEVDWSLRRCVWAGQNLRGKRPDRSGSIHFLKASLSDKGGNETGPFTS
jgi:hypothetical protein